MRVSLTSLAGSLSASLLAACSPAGLLGSMQPAAPGGESRDIAYASGPRHQMDVYEPAAAGTARPPVVVFFYGGGWTSGDRAKYRFVGRNLAACGALTVIPDYRVWPDAGFTGFLRDAATAVRRGRDEAARLGGDPSRLYLIGHSAGAYIAAMLALDPRWLNAQGIDPGTDLAGVIGISGPYDFLPLKDPVLENIFAPVGPETQPITFAANAKAPMLLITGDADRTVYPANSIRLAAKAMTAGAAVETIVYPNIGHVSSLTAIAAPLRGLAPLRDDLCRFLRLPQPGRAQAGIQGSAASPDHMPKGSPG